MLAAGCRTAAHCSVVHVHCTPLGLYFHILFPQLKTEFKIIKDNIYKVNEVRITRTHSVFRLIFIANIIYHENVVFKQLHSSERNWEKRFMEF